MGKSVQSHESGGSCRDALRRIVGRRCRDRSIRRIVGLTRESSAMFDFGQESTWANCYLGHFDLGQVRLRPSSTRPSSTQAKFDLGHFLF